MFVSFEHVKVIALVWVVYFKATLIGIVFEGGGRRGGVERE